MRFCWYGLLPQKQKHPILIIHILYVLLAKTKRDTKVLSSNLRFSSNSTFCLEMKDTVFSDALLYSTPDFPVSFINYLFLEVARLMLSLLAPYFFMNTSFLTFLFDRSSNISIFSSSLVPPFSDFSYQKKISMLNKNAQKKRYSLNL